MNLGLVSSIACGAGRVGLALATLCLPASAAAGERAALRACRAVAGA
jgi:hypothetical protein